MNGAFYIGATGLNAQQSAVSATANNIANMNTPAFKRAAVSFSEVLAASAQPLLPVSNVSVDQVAGVMADVSARVFTPGELRPTGNMLDIAVRGDGLIELASDAGQPMLWRGGTLRVGEDGYLATSNGMPLKAMISVPRDASAITVLEDGRVQATVPDQAQPMDIGQLELVHVDDTRDLQPQGEGLYQLRSDAAALQSFKPGEGGTGAFVQGFSEASNVSLTDELTHLMLYQRVYAANARLVQVGDELMAIANGLKR